MADDQEEKRQKLFRQLLSPDKDLDMDLPKGGVMVRIYHEGDKVLMEFGSSIRGVAFDVSAARDIARMLMQQAELVERNKG